MVKQRLVESPRDVSLGVFFGGTDIEQRRRREKW
jgi:hypothetical protein